MHTFSDKKGRQIRLSEEREKHLKAEHPEMENQLNKIALTLLDPDRIIRSRTDDEAELHYRLFKTTPVTIKHLCIVIKATDADSFIITVYFTDTVKKGDVLWEKK